MGSKTAWHSNHGESPTTVIVGAGISGICIAIDLLRQDKASKFVIIEKGNQIGGTWNDNQYPGCCCDVWSHLYSLSFEPNPEWTREYPGQEEIHQYLKRVCHKWGLYSYIRFNTQVEEARWQEESKQWFTNVKVTGGKAAEFGESYTITSSYLVSAVGQLNTPRWPDIPGRDDFKGTMMHSARWNWNKPIAGLKVGIIGNGATAAQIIPEVAKTVKKLTVFQRTPNWVVPRADQMISATRKFVYRHIPYIRKRYRASLMDFRESFYDAAVVEHSDMNEEVRRQCTEMMKAQLVDKPQLAPVLTPDYPPGCKRIIISDDYYPAINRSNVELETGAIERITADGIIVDGKEIPLDVLVSATGFQTLDFMYPIKVYGENGRSLQDIWPQCAQAYLGITVESLPNFSMMYGPNTNLGHNSIILMIEAQSRYVTTMISKITSALSHGQTLKITPCPTTLKSYNEEIQARLNKSTFASDSCRSWYKNAEGKITNNWCGSVVEYQQRVSQIDWDDYVVEGTGKAMLAEGKKTKIGRVVEESSLATSLWPVLGAVSIVGAATIWVARPSRFRFRLR